MKQGETMDFGILGERGDFMMGFVHMFSMDKSLIGWFFGHGKSM